MDCHLEGLICQQEPAHFHLCFKLRDIARLPINKRAQRSLKWNVLEADDGHAVCGQRPLNVQQLASTTAI